MSRQPNGSGRYYVTLEEADADALDAAARAQGRPPTTEAGLRIVRTLRTEDEGVADELSKARAEVAELGRRLDAARVENAALLRRIGEGVADVGDGRGPRWEWPLEDLLADRPWWSTWLPRLHEVLGRPLPAYGIGNRQPQDERGYVDLMARLFPPIRLADGADAEWHLPDYPALVLRYSEPDANAARARADIWQPVIRRVAVALAALEQTATPGADPVQRIHVEDELSGPWLRTLRRLTGDETADLPGGGGPM